MSFKEKLKAFFTSYTGLISLITIYETLIVLFLATFSEPMVHRFGHYPLTEWIFPLIKGLPEDGHTARAIMLYHAVAIPFLVAVVFLFMKDYEIRPNLEPIVKWSLVVGAFTASLAGLTYAYFIPNNWVFHGLFIAGQSITFFGGVLFMISTWPTKNFPVNDNIEGAVIGGINWEYINLTFTTFAILTSTIIGAIAASYFGQVDPNYLYNPFTGQPDPNYEFVPVLLEDIVRRDPSNVGYSFYELLVSHLHIMVALLAAAILLYTFRFANMKGRWFKINQILYLPGAIILSGGAWLVITPWSKAHLVINVGAGILLIAGLIVTIWGMIQISKETLGKAYEAASVGQKIKGIFGDAAKFGVYWQLILSNFVVTFPGIYVGVKLEEFREIDFKFETAFNVGHWHILATTLAMMVALILIDHYKIVGKWRKIAGWSITIGSTIGFGFATKYMLRRSDAAVETDFIFIDIGLAIVFIAIGVLFVWILIDHFKNNNAEIAEVAE